MRKVLIANRGEIALRIIRACRELGLLTVCVYSKADKKSLHVSLADEAVCIGPAQSIKSYLDINNVLSAADITNADAIHPGFGFLSENAEFADICEKKGLIFIGPKASMIEKMGNKSAAKDTMIKAGVPVVPGSDGIVSDIKKGLSISKDIGFPVLIKASAGGGGKGMRIVRSESEFVENFKAATSEARAAFKDDSVYIEKFIENPRHIEFQIIGDTHGNITHLGERDCSIQRRNQKIIEEAPSSFMTDELRQKMSEAALKAARAVNYINAGTIEFIVDKDKNFYFIEMNTRIQVEHPVTEFVTGIDIVKEQLRVAMGESLSFTQDDIKIMGHAIECRINAENPDLNFRPSPGVIKRYLVPGGFGVRVDSAAYQGYEITPYYDSMIGKLIVWDKDRKSAISKMRRALNEYKIDGIDTNISFHKEILKNDKFISGDIDTGFVANIMKR